MGELSQFLNPQDHTSSFPMVCRAELGCGKELRAVRGPWPGGVPASRNPAGLTQALQRGHQPPGRALPPPFATADQLIR